MIFVYHARCPEESCNDDYVSERARRSGRNKKSHFKTPNLKKNTLVCNTRILKLLVAVFVITLRRENYQKCCGLTLSHLPKNKQ